MKRLAYAAATGAILAALTGTTALAQDAWTYPVYNITPPREDGTAHPEMPQLSDFTSNAPGSATKKSQMCLLMPQTQDAVFIAYIYGAISEAQRLGQALTVFDAGGYANDPTQRAQFENCLTLGVDAILMQPVNATGWEDDLGRAKAAGIKVINVVEAVAAPLDGRSLVNFIVNGKLLGETIAKAHPAGGEAAHVLVLPGAAGLPFVEDTVAGVKAGVEGSAAVVDDVIYAGMTETEQLKVVEDALVAHPDVNYIVGNAMAVKQAVNVLAQQGRTGQVQLLATYLDTDVLAAIAAGDILAGSGESSTMLTRIGVDLAVRAIGGDATVHDIIPSVGLVTKEYASSKEVIDANFPPQGWQPIFKVE